MDRIKQRLADGRHFQVYNNGIIYCSVCTELPIDEATEWVNVLNPTGTSGRWEKADEDFAGGESNPCDCPDIEDSKHYLFSC